MQTPQEPTPAALRQVQIEEPRGGARVREVHTIYCVGKNYAEHAREMGSEPQRGEPTIFLKPAASLRCGPKLELSLPAWSSLVHHEVELVVLIGRGFDAAAPLDCVEGYGIGLDLTLRDLQNKAKAAGSPWTASKGFPGAALVSELRPASGQDPAKFELELAVNGQARQKGSTSEMLHDLPGLLRHLGERYGLLGGELLYTGTPAGVGPIGPGDRLECRLSGPDASYEARLAVRVL